MSANLQGQVALVTGASRGIGRAIAIELAKQGAKVIGTTTSEAGAAAITEYLNALQPEAGKGVALNVNDAEACGAVVEQVPGTLVSVELGAEPLCVQVGDAHVVASGREAREHALQRRARERVVRGVAEHDEDLHSDRANRSQRSRNSARSAGVDESMP